MNDIYEYKAIKYKLKYLKLKNDLKGGVGVDVDRSFTPKKYEELLQPYRQAMQQQAIQPQQQYVQPQAMSQQQYAQPQYVQPQAMSQQQYAQTMPPQTMPPQLQLQQQQYTMPPQPPQTIYTMPPQQPQYVQVQARTMPQPRTIPQPQPQYVQVQARTMQQQPRQLHTIPIKEAKIKLINLIESIKEIIKLNNNEELIFIIPTNKQIQSNNLIDNFFDSNFKLELRNITRQKYYTLISNDFNQKYNYSIPLQLIIKYFLKIKDKDNNKKYLKKELIELLLNEQKLDLDNELKELKKKNPNIENYFKEIHKKVYGDDDKSFDIYKSLEIFLYGTVNSRYFDLKKLEEIFKNNFLSFYTKYDLNYYQDKILKITMYEDILKLFDYLKHVIVQLIAYKIYNNYKIYAKLLAEITYLRNKIVLGISIRKLDKIFDKIIEEINNIKENIS